MALKTKATDGIATKALRQAEQTISGMLFSCPAQPSHLPDMGMSVGISVAMEVADAEPMSKSANPCMTRPAAKMRAATIAEARRSFMNAIRSS
jgi:hypothetical protein